MMNLVKKIMIFVLIILISVLAFLIRDFKREADAEAAEGTIIVYENTTETEADPFESYIDLVIDIAENEPTYPVVDGETKYGALFGHPTYAWCTEFVMYCLQQAEEQLGTAYIGDIYPWLDSAYECGLWYREQGRYFAAGTYTPVKGDLIFYDYEGNGYPDHTGLVIGTTYQYGIEFVLTIEGNIPGDDVSQIRLMQIPLDDERIFAYGSCFTVSDVEWSTQYY